MVPYSQNKYTPNSKIKKTHELYKSDKLSISQKAFLSDQCKEIEENNRMGKTRDLFKKIRDTKGTFHAKMSTIKDRNSMDRSRTHRTIQKKILMTWISTMV